MVSDRHTTDAALEAGEEFSLEFGGCEEAEIESIESDTKPILGGRFYRRSVPPIWFKQCKSCGLPYNVLKVVCPSCHR
jgi:hypothetical protein